MKVLLVAIAVGDKYLGQYERLFKKSQELYAKRNGYDFKVITEYLDKEHSRMELVSLMKLLLGSQEWSMEYDYIVYIDADIFINPNAPPIHTAIDYQDKIGMVDEYSQPTQEKRIQIQEVYGWEPSAKEYYRLCGFDLDTKIVFNGGVIVFQPKLHASFLQFLYKSFFKICLVHPRGFHYEQSAVGYTLQIQKNYVVLDNKFNAIWSLEKYGNQLDNTPSDLEAFFNQNYFIHFAGNIDYDKVELLDKYLTESVAE